jgi:hypothetical protein
MTGTRAWASVLALVACCVFCGVPMGQVASAQDTGKLPRAPGVPIHFELPALPLAEAIRAYGRITQLLVMADTPVLNGHTSTPLSGDYSPLQALQILLAGTGLDAQFVDAESIVIVPMSPAQRNLIPPSSVSVAPSDIDGLSENAAYATLIQVRLTEALCRSSQTQPGNYRLVVQLRIDASGAVMASKVLDSTGDSARDAAIAQAVRELVIDESPPPTLPQPVTILLRPQDGRVASGCAQSAQQG